MSELKPCPFCGGEPYNSPQDKGASSQGKIRAVWCETCEAMGPEKIGPDSAASDAAAITSWNTRTDPAPASSETREGEVGTDVTPERRIRVLASALNEASTELAVARAEVERLSGLWQTEYEAGMARDALIAQMHGALEAFGNRVPNVMRNSKKPDGTIVALAGQELGDFRKAAAALAAHAAHVKGEVGIPATEQDQAVSEAVCKDSLHNDPRLELAAWQPIETAPKDGTWFIALQNGDELYPCDWHCEEPDEGPPQEGWFDYFNRSFEAPTHWMPLPKTESNRRAPGNRAHRGRVMGDPRFIRHDETSCLAHVVEECGEVCAAIGKAQRWGLDSVNPLLPKEQQETNGAWIKRELADLRAALDRLERHLP